MATDYTLAADLNANKPSQIAALCLMTDETWNAYNANDVASTALPEGPVKWMHDEAMPPLAAKADALSRAILYSQPTDMADAVSLVSFIASEQQDFDATAVMDPEKLESIRYATDSLLAFLGREGATRSSHVAQAVAYSINRTRIRTTAVVGGAA